MLTPSLTAFWVEVCSLLCRLGIFSGKRPHWVCGVCIHFLRRDSHVPGSALDLHLCTVNWLFHINLVQKVSGEI